MAITRNGKICSFCGTPGGPGTDLLLIGGLGAQICATCVDDFHATLLHLLGFDHERLTFRHAGRDFRLTDVSGEVVRDVLA